LENILRTSEYGMDSTDSYGIASIFYRSVPPPIVHIHLKLIDLKNVPALTGGEMATPAEAREFELWLRSVWEEKEERLQQEQPVGEEVVIRQM
jgi:lysocardiolipin and lysophospholipid acyltransferase